MVLNFAHRGSMTEAPENTISAIKKAVAHGAKGIELDVQLTKDQQLIVVHDHHFKRLSPGVPGKVNEFTLEEIKHIDVGSAFSDEYAGESLATLDEILDILPRETILNIEIKNIPLLHEGIEGILIDCLKNRQREENVWISSFDHEALAKVQHRAPHIPIGLLFYYRMIQPWTYAKQTGLDIYSIHPNAVYTDEAFITACHEAGYKVYPFTVNRRRDYEKLTSAGVDGIFSNNPELFGTN